MPAPKPIPIEAEFPLLGTNQGTALAKQPRGTSPNLLNVRDTDVRDRTGGGKRAGHAKALTAQAGLGVASQRILNLALLSDARSPPASLYGASQPVSNTFTAIPNAQPPDLLSVTTVPAGHGGDLVGFQHNNYVGAAVIGAWTGFRGVTATPSLDFDYFTGVRNADGASVPKGMAVNFLTTNDVTLTLSGLHTMDFLTLRGWGAVGEAGGVGPFIRGYQTGGDNLATMIAARIRPTAINTCVVDIVVVGTADPYTILASSPPIAMSGVGGPSDLTIRLYETATGVTAQVDWAAMAPAQTIVSVATTFNASNTRAGFMWLTVATVNAAGTAPPGATVASFRIFKGFTYTKLVPQANTVYNSSPVEYNNAGNQFFVPTGSTGTGFRSFTLASDGSTTAPVDSTAGDVGYGGVNQAWPTLDDNNNRHGIQAVAPVTRYGFLGQVTPPASGERRGVAVKGLPGFVSSGVQTQDAGVAFRVGDNGLGLIGIRSNRSDGGAANGENAFASARLQAWGSGANLTVDEAVAGVITNFPGNQKSAVIYREESEIRFTDDGTTIRGFVNGIQWYSYIPTAGAAALAANTRCGGYLRQRPSGAAVSTFLGTVSIVQGENFVTDYSEADPVLLVQCAGKTEIGNIRNNTLQACGGFPSLTGAMPMATSLARKFYAVDGTAHAGAGTGGIIIDPVLLSVSDWNASVGTAPWDDGTIGPCRLIETYRARLVVARATQVPTFWGMTRQAAPLDFQYNTPPLTTSAYTGRVGEAGEPGEAITCLKAFRDDFLLFGCVNSIARMEGDPGYKGGIQNVSPKTGILGPRSGCFDDAGNFFFVGSGGFFVLPTGAAIPKQLSEDKMVRFFNRVDLTRTLVQMAFDSFRRLIHIWFTATDGATNNNHAVYKPQTGAFWIDNHPLRFGPWAVCDSAGSTYIDRGYLIGGTDGYIRRPYDLSFSDDGDSIDSWVEFGPWSLEGGLVESICTELQANIGAGSGVVTWYWFVADSAEEVAAQDFPAAVASGLWGGSNTGWQEPVGLRERAAWHKLRVRNQSSDFNWSLEKINFLLQPRSGRR